MPMPGDQHKDTPATTNPFIEQKPHLSEFTAQEVATLQSRLERQLGPEYISTRPGNGGGKVHYLAAEKVINLANEVFGFNGWNSSIQNIQIDFVDENRENGKITLGLSTIVRVTLKDGTFHEDIGYGHIENCKGKAAAFEKAKKEGATDALKRALRNFGNVLGNCLYDKDYLAKVQKMKVAPSRWSEDNLHRHHDFAPVKKETAAEPAAARLAAQEPASRRQSSGQSYGSIELEDEFGGSALDETDFNHPDEVLLRDTPAKPSGAGAQPPNGAHRAQQQQAMRRMHSMPQLRPPNNQPSESGQNHLPPGPNRPQQAQQRPQANAVQAQPNNAAQQRQAPNHMPPPQAANNNQQPRPPIQQLRTTKPQAQHQPQADSNGCNSNTSSGTAADSPSEDGPRMPPPGVLGGFVTGRNADILNAPVGTVQPASAAIAFNPHADSPSLRRTAGLNPGKSAPITRSAIAAATGQQLQPPPQPQGPVQRPHSPAPPAQGSFQHGAGHQNGAPQTPVRTNFVNPSADPTRRIGMPTPGGGRPQNRGEYRMPQMAAGVKRPPLSDVSNLQQMDGAGDGKKSKTEPQAAAASENVAPPAAPAEGEKTGA